jgi:hypothetical protein
VVIGAGLVPVSVHRGLIWQTMVFERTET